MNIEQSHLIVSVGTFVLPNLKLITIIVKLSVNNVKYNSYVLNVLKVVAVFTSVSCKQII